MSLRGCRATPLAHQDFVAAKDQHANPNAWLLRHYTDYIRGWCHKSLTSNLELFAKLETCSSHVSIELLLMCESLTQRDAQTGSKLVLNITDFIRAYKAGGSAL